MNNMKGRLTLIIQFCVLSGWWVNIINVNCNQDSGAKQKIIGLTVCFGVDFNLMYK